MLLLLRLLLLLGLGFCRWYPSAASGYPTWWLWVLWWWRWSCFNFRRRTQRALDPNVDVLPWPSPFHRFEGDLGKLAEHEHLVFGGEAQLLGAGQDRGLAVPQPHSVTGAAVVWHLVGVLEPTWVGNFVADDPRNTEPSVHGVGRLAR